MKRGSPCLQGPHRPLRTWGGHKITAPWKCQLRARRGVMGASRKSPRQTWGRNSPLEGGGEGLAELWSEGRYSQQRVELANILKGWPGSPVSWWTAEGWVWPVGTAGDEARRGVQRASDHERPRLSFQGSCSLYGSLWEATEGGCQTFLRHMESLGNNLMFSVSSFPP